MFVFGQYVVQYTLLQKMAERCMNSKKKNGIKSTLTSLWCCNHTAQVQEFALNPAFAHDIERKLCINSYNTLLALFADEKGVLLQSSGFMVSHKTFTSSCISLLLLSLIYTSSSMAHEPATQCTSAGGDTNSFKMHLYLFVWCEELALKWIFSSSRLTIGKDNFCREIWFVFINHQWVWQTLMFILQLIQYFFLELCIFF